MGKQLDLEQYIQEQQRSIRLAVIASTQGWYVFLPREKGDAPEGHYVRGDELGISSMCGARQVIGQERQWSVYQDVGRIPLCEDCKDALRREKGSSDDDGGVGRQGAGGGQSGDERVRDQDHHGQDADGDVAGPRRRVRGGGKSRRG
jgi:hypothetical protein